MKKVKLTLQGKDPDMHYEVEIVVDPETGKGTARFIEL